MTDFDQNSPAQAPGLFCIGEPLLIPFLLETAQPAKQTETILGAETWYCVISFEPNGSELAMHSQSIDDFEQIDPGTCRSIRDAIGERLQQSFRPETSGLSSHLERLMDELRRRDSESHY